MCPFRIQPRSNRYERSPLHRPASRNSSVLTGKSGRRDQYARRPNFEIDTTILYGWHPVAEALRNGKRDDSPDPGDGELRPTSERGTGAPCLSNLRSSGRTRSTGFSSPMRSTRGSTPRPIPCPRPHVDTLSGTRVVLALDQITDPHNVGAIVRTAAAFDVEAIITTARHSPAATGVLAKSASGGLEHVPFMIVRNLGDALTALGRARLPANRPRFAPARRIWTRCRSPCPSSWCWDRRARACARGPVIAAT